MSPIQVASQALTMGGILESTVNNVALLFI
jgi:hypothetical protein